MYLISSNVPVFEVCQKCYDKTRPHVAFRHFFVLAPLGQQRVLARKVAHTPSSAYSDDKMLIETLKKDYWHVLYGKILIYWEVG